MYCALLMPIEMWTSNLTLWLSFRKNLYATYGIPADFELHAAELIGGKDRPSSQFSFGPSELRNRVMELAVATIGAMSDIRIVSKVEPHVSPKDCYRHLLRKLDDIMTAEESWSLLVVDGNDPAHRTAHRDLSLTSRRIVEDPWMQDSKRSQFVQMADIAAHTVFQAHKLRTSRRFMWGWMITHLHRREWPGSCVCP